MNEANQKFGVSFYGSVEPSVLSAISKLKSETIELTNKEVAEKAVIDDLVKGYRAMRDELRLRSDAVTAMLGVENAENKLYSDRAAIRRATHDEFMRQMKEEDAARSRSIKAGASRADENIASQHEEIYARKAQAAKLFAQADAIEAKQIAAGNKAWMDRANLIGAANAKQEAALKRMSGPRGPGGGADGMGEGSGGGSGGGRTSGMLEHMLLATAIYGTISAMKKGLETYAEFEVETVKLGWAGKNIAEGFTTQHDAAVALTGKILNLKQAYGSLGTESMQSADVFARLGESQEEIVRDTGVAVKLGMVGQMPAQEVARLGEAMRLEFGLSANEFEKVADKLAKIGFMGPATIKGLLEGGTKVGAVWKQAGGRLEEVFAIIGAGRMGGRTESEVATAVRTMMVRLGIEKHQEKLYDITKKATGEGLNVVSSSGEMLPPQQIFEKIHDVWTKMKDSGRDDLSSELGFEVGGTRGANILASIMTNMGKDKEYLNAMDQGSGGELNKKAAESLNTLSGATRKASAALEVFAAKMSGPGGVAMKMMEAATVLINKAGGGNSGTDQTREQVLIEELSNLKSGGITGAIGQGIRTLVGLGGMRDELIAAKEKELYDLQHPGVAEARKKEEAAAQAAQDNEDFAGVYRGGAKKQAEDDELIRAADRSRALTAGMDELDEPKPIDDATGRIKAFKAELDALKHYARGANDELEKYNSILSRAAAAGKHVKDAVDEYANEHKILQHVNDELQRRNDLMAQIDRHAAAAEAKTQAKLNTFKRFGRGAGSAMEENREERTALLLEKAKLLGGGSITAANAVENSADPNGERKARMMEIEAELHKNARGIVNAKLQDELKSLEIQQKKNDALAKSLAMLSDEDMLKLRILKGEMARGEIKSTMTKAEFMTKPASLRKEYVNAGGKVIDDDEATAADGEVEEKPKSVSTLHFRHSAKYKAGAYGNNFGEGFGGGGVLNSPHKSYDSQGRLVAGSSSGEEEKSSNMKFRHSKEYERGHYGSNFGEGFGGGQMQPPRPPPTRHQGVGATSQGGSEVDALALAIAREVYQRFEPYMKKSNMADQRGALTNRPSPRSAT